MKRIITTCFLSTFTLICKVQLTKVGATKNQTVPWLTKSQIDLIGPKSWGGWQSSKLTIYLRQILWQLMSRMFLLQLILLPPANRHLRGGLGPSKEYKREWHWTFLCFALSWNIPEQDVLGSNIIKDTIILPLIQSNEICVIAARCLWLWANLWQKSHFGVWDGSYWDRSEFLGLGILNF